MLRKGWYLVTYDITDNKRLIKVHRFLKKEGLAAQKSVFFVFGTENRIEDILDEITAIISPSKDDLRAYPITCPDDVWTSRTNPIGDFPMIYYGHE